MAKKNKNSVGHSITYILSMLAAVALIVVSYFAYKAVTGMSYIPARYLEIFLYALIGGNVFFCLLAFIPGIGSAIKWLQIVLCTVLAALLAVVSIKIPDYQGQFERMFREVPEEGTLLMSVYAFADSDKIQTVKDLGEARIGVLEGKDTEYLEYSAKVIARELNGQQITTIPYSDIYQLADAYYEGAIDAMLINETYARFISESTDFEGFNYQSRIIYTVEHKVQLNYETNDVGSITTEPFIIAVSGNDTWGYSNIKTTSQTRSDVNMLLVVNPTTKQVLVVSIPRDTYVPLWGDSTCMDKLTHATIYGIDTWEKAINSLLGVKINYFVRVNFQSVVNAVDALGGIDIDNPYEMTIRYNAYNKSGKKTVEKFTYKQGIIHINGNQTLGYVRERKSLKEGDVDRVRHQAIVIQGVIDKVTQVSVITKINDLLAAVDGTFVTDVKLNQIYALLQMQLDDMASWHISTVTITGSEGMRTSYAMGNKATTSTKTVEVEEVQTDEDGNAILDEEGNPVVIKVKKTVTVKHDPALYSVFIPDDSSVSQAKNKIQKVLKGEILSD